MTAENSDNDETQAFTALTPGTEIGHYRVVRKIGAGGMGEVFLAGDTKLNRQVALKFLPPHLCRDEECRRRFIREAQAAARLNHPNIITVYEVGDFHGRPFIAMQYIEGLSLSEMLQQKQALDNQTAVEIALQLAEGLSKAHDTGIIHRDIKPSNILLDGDGRPMLVDFGLASVKDSDKLTQTGSTLGTMGYLSPEQIEGGNVDARSDLFSLGVLLYELVAGRNPFRQDSQAATINAILKGTPEPLTQYKRDVPTILQNIIDRLLEKNPAHRYQNAVELITDLKKLTRESVDIDTSPSGGLSIAVLPFANLSADPEQEYFCDGISEEIINVLTQIEDIKVVARTSCFAFKGKVEDVRQIGRKLGVNHVLEGSVRKSGNRIRITSQLINVTDGYHLWSEKFDRNLEDIFAIQDEISLAIVDRLKLKLLKSKKESLVDRYTHNIEAYNLYLKGRYHWNKRSAENLEKAIDCFQQVIAIDPEHALAYAALADCYNLMTQAWALTPKEAFPKAKAAALKALELDSELAEAKTALAFVKCSYEWDMPVAEELFKAAIKLNPNYPTAHHWYAIYLMSVNRLQEAIAEIQRARDLDPLSFIITLALAIIYLVNGRYDEAEEECRKAHDLDPNNYMIHAILGMLYESQKDFEKAFEEYTQIERETDFLKPHQEKKLREEFSSSGWRGYLKAHAEFLIRQAETRYVPSSAIARDFASLGDKDKAFEWLERAYLERDLSLIGLSVDLMYANLRSDSRFTALLKRMGLEQYQ